MAIQEFIKYSNSVCPYSILVAIKTINKESFHFSTPHLKAHRVAFKMLMSDEKVDINMIET